MIIEMSGMKREGWRRKGKMGKRRKEERIEIIRR